MMLLLVPFCWDEVSEIWGSVMMILSFFWEERRPRLRRSMSRFEARLRGAAIVQRAVRVLSFMVVVCMVGVWGLEIGIAEREG